MLKNADGTLQTLMENTKFDIHSDVIAAVTFQNSI